MRRSNPLPTLQSGTPSFPPSSSSTPSTTFVSFAPDRHRRHDNVKGFALRYGRPTHDRPTQHLITSEYRRLSRSRAVQTNQPSLATVNLEPVTRAKDAVLLEVQDLDIPDIPFSFEGWLRRSDETAETHFVSDSFRAL